MLALKNERDDDVNDDNVDERIKQMNEDEGMFLR